MLPHGPLAFGETIGRIDSRGVKVLVTGGAGNIGSSVCQRRSVAHGHEVVSFDQRPGEGRGHRVQGVSYRLGDHEGLGQVVEVAAGTDAIAHLSAIPGPGRSPTGPSSAPT